MAETGTSLREKLEDIGAAHVADHPMEFLSRMAAEPTGGLQERSGDEPGVLVGGDWSKEFAQLVQHVADNTTIQVDSEYELRKYAVKSGKPILAEITDADFYDSIDTTSGVIPPTVVADPRDSTGSAKSEDVILDQLTQRANEEYDEDPADLSQPEEQISWGTLDEYHDADTSRSFDLSDQINTSRVSTGADVSALKEDVQNIDDKFENIEDDIVTEQEMRKLINEASNWSFDESKQCELAEELWNMLNVESYIDAGGVDNFDSTVDNGNFRDNIMAVQGNADAIAESELSMGLIFSADQV